MQIFLPFYWPRAHHVTCKELSTNNGLLMCNVVFQLCLAANNILLMRKRNYAFLLLAIAFAWKWQMASSLWVYSLKRNSHSNDKTILNSTIAKYRDLSVSRRSIITGDNWCARHWQITGILLNFVQKLLIIMRLRRKLGQNLSPKKSHSAIRHNTD